MTFKPIRESSQSVSPFQRIKEPLIDIPTKKGVVTIYFAIPEDKRAVN